MTSNHLLLSLYQTLLKAYGPQYWWPGEHGFEVIIGAILTQNTNWNNVEKALANLKKAGVPAPETMDALDHDTLAALIRPAGYYNLKARRLKNFVRWFVQNYAGDLQALRQIPKQCLREELLAINGIGRETADAILLYALEMPTFVVDAYTCRVLYRHGCISAEDGYEEVKDFCERHLPEEVSLYNEFHALLVRVGKECCRPRARCRQCPLREFPHQENGL